MEDKYLRERRNYLKPGQRSHGTANHTLACLSFDAKNSRHFGHSMSLEGLGAKALKCPCPCPRVGSDDDIVVRQRR
jgi:hypothetical protein